MMIAYGYEGTFLNRCYVFDFLTGYLEVKPENDPYIELAEKAISTLTESTSFFVNYFPICKRAFRRVCSK